MWYLNNFFKLTNRPDYHCWNCYSIPEIFLAKIGKLWWRIQRYHFSSLNIWRISFICFVYFDVKMNNVGKERKFLWNNICVQIGWGINHLLVSNISHAWALAFKYSFYITIPSAPKFVLYRNNHLEHKSH